MVWDSWLAMVRWAAPTLARDNPRVHTMVKAYNTRAEAMDALRRAAGSVAVVHQSEGGEK